MAMILFYSKTKVSSDDLGRQLTCWTDGQTVTHWHC